MNDLYFLTRPEHPFPRLVKLIDAVHPKRDRIVLDCETGDEITIRHDCDKLAPLSDDE